MFHSRGNSLPYSWTCVPCTHNPTHDRSIGRQVGAQYNRRAVMSEIQHDKLCHGVIDVSDDALLMLLLLMFLSPESSQTGGLGQVDRCVDVLRYGSVDMWTWWMSEDCVESSSSADPHVPCGGLWTRFAACGLWRTSSQAPVPRADPQLHTCTFPPPPPPLAAQQEQARGQRSRNATTCPIRPIHSQSPLYLCPVVPVLDYCTRTRFHLHTHQTRASVILSSSRSALW
jgi:hypothetical protein